MIEYLEPAWFNECSGASRPAWSVATSQKRGRWRHRDARLAIDRTVKLYIGGKQARPDSGVQHGSARRKGELLGEAPLGNRKDIRNAVEAARKASGSGRRQRRMIAHRCSTTSRKIFRSGSERSSRRLAAVVGQKQAAGSRRQHRTQFSLTRRGRISLRHGAQSSVADDRAAMKKPIGTVGIICPDEAPLLGFLSLALPAIAVGNTVGRGSFARRIR